MAVLTTALCRNCNPASMWGGRRFGAHHAEHQQHAPWIRCQSAGSCNASTHAHASIRKFAVCAPGADEQAAGPGTQGAPPQLPPPPLPAGRRTHAAAEPAAAKIGAESALHFTSLALGQVPDVWRVTCLHFALRDELVRELQRRVALLHLRLTRQEPGQRLGLLVHLPQQALPLDHRPGQPCV